MSESMCLDGMVMLPDSSHFSLIDVRPEQIEIADIASTLSMTCRFGARVRRWLSVAEHSIWCAHAAHADGVSPEGCFAVLMHDAQEFIVQDLSSPLKRMLPGYWPIESRIADAVGHRFGIDFAKWGGVIHEIDSAVVLAERRALYPNYAGAWPNEDGVRRLDIQFEFMNFQQAEELFLRYFYWLCDKERW